jgi:putative hydrolase of the HAD superfamily
MKKYEFLLFDFDGTLADYDRTEKYSLAHAFQQAGLPYNEDICLAEYHRINSQMWKSFEEGGISAPELRVRRFRMLFESCGIQGDPELVAGMYLSSLAESAFLFPGVLPLLEKLRPRYKLGLITNGLKEVQRRRLALSGADKYMSGIAVSDEIGIQKPSAGIFEYALKDAGHTDKSTSLVIGDSLSSDIQGGINFGIDTCWFNPGRKAAATGIVPMYEITRLEELYGILE